MLSAALPPPSVTCSTLVMFQIAATQFLRMLIVVPTRQRSISARITYDRQAGRQASRQAGSEEEKSGSRQQRSIDADRQTTCNTSSSADEILSHLVVPSGGSIRICLVQQQQQQKMYILYIHTYLTLPPVLTTHTTNNNNVVYTSHREKDGWID